MMKTGSGYIKAGYARFCNGKASKFTEQGSEVLAGRYGWRGARMWHGRLCGLVGSLDGGCVPWGLLWRMVEKICRLFLF